MEKLKHGKNVLETEYKISNRASHSETFNAYAISKPYTETEHTPCAIVNEPRPLEGEEI
jgi:hypothetical protein